MEAFLTSMLIAATPLLLAATGELVAEKSGVLNLGVEGMMLIGAVTAFAVAFSTGSSGLAVMAGAGAGLVMAALFAGIALYAMANQMATGLALTIFGIGASGLLGQGFVGQTVEPLARLDVQ
ncbi:MAG: ABC transporter permease, partial [Pseudomonadota bacterium]